MALFSVKNAYRLALSIMTVFIWTPAFAHVDASHVAIGFGTGFIHPFSGIDHLLAMLAVGLWAAQNKRRALWVLPIVFPLMMAVGAVMGVAGVRVFGVEMGIASSVVALGLLIAFAIKIPLWAGSVAVSLFALMHGYAHGAELPKGTSALLYGAGFMAATLALHLLGLMVGLVAGDKMAGKVVRVVGAGIAATGIYLVVGLA